MKKNILFFLIVNLFLLLILEVSVRVFASLVGFSPTSGVESNQMGMKFNYLTGYYNEPYQTERMKENSEFIKVLSTDRYGFNLNNYEDKDRDLNKKNKCEFRIFIFGGSTVQGRFLKSNTDTLAAKIYENFNTLFLKNNLSLKVINAGVSSFQLSQELQLYQNKALYALQPDYAIFFNGFNDFYNRISEKLSKENHNAHIYQIKFEENYNSYLSDDLNYFSHDYTFKFFKYFDRFLRENISFYNVLSRLINDPELLKKSMNKFFFTQGSDNKKYIKYEIKDESKKNKLSNNQKYNEIDKQISRYFYNAGILNKISNERQRISIFFQPTMNLEDIQNLSKIEKQLYNNYKHKKWSGESFFLAKQIYYYKMRNKIRKFKNKENFRIIDLSKIFQDKSNKVSYYGDTIHYTNEGRNVIVKEIIDKIEYDLLDSIKNNYTNCL